MSGRDDYAGFLAAKAPRVQRSGLASVPPLAGHLFSYQRACVAFGLEAGRWGLFLDTGLGKTACELEWCRHAAEASNGRALILTPLAVAAQIVREGQRWGYEVRTVRSQADAGEGINVCNYDRLHLLDPSAFGAIALDESSILRNFAGAVSRGIREAFAGHRFRLSASATPAPNDHTEIAQHSDFLGIYSRDEMLVRWFINDSGDSKSWRLKGHAVRPFWDWMATWARCAEHPRDLGDDQPGFDLPPLRIHRHRAEESHVGGGGLFGVDEVSATDMHRIKRATSEARARLAAEIVASGDGPCVLWVDTDYEADAVAEAIPAAIEVRGSHSIDRKEEALLAFVTGEAPILLTKPGIAGYGLNLQFCSRQVFVGRTFSYEQWYQAVRRCWRFGQRNPVDVHLIVAEGEDAIGRVIDRKAAGHVQMRAEMVAAMRRAMQAGEAPRRVKYNPTHTAALPRWMEA